MRWTIHRERAASKNLWYGFDRLSIIDLSTGIYDEIARSGSTGDAIVDYDEGRTGFGRRPAAR